MSHEELLKKYNIQASEFKDQKEEIANIFLSELAKMQQAEGCGRICHFLTRGRRFFHSKIQTLIVADRENAISKKYSPIWMKINLV